MRMTSSHTYLPPGPVDEENLITGEVCPATWSDGSTSMPPIARQYFSNNYRKDGEAVRNWYTKEFMTRLAVPWQMKSVNFCPGDVAENYHDENDITDHESK
nr:unnamed protein product [Callosobruchus analis]